MYALIRERIVFRIGLPESNVYFLSSAKSAKKKPFARRQLPFSSRPVNLVIIVPLPFSSESETIRSIYLRGLVRQTIRDRPAFRSFAYGTVLYERPFSVVCRLKTTLTTSAVRPPTRPSRGGKRHMNSQQVSAVTSKIKTLLPPHLSHPLICCIGAHTIYRGALECVRIYREACVYT